jgi:hypothetical protein
MSSGWMDNLEVLDSGMIEFEVGLGQGLLQILELCGCQ